MKSFSQHVNEGLWHLKLPPLEWPNLAVNMDRVIGIYRSEIELQWLHTGMSKYFL